VYARAVREAWRTYIGPPTCYPFLEPNRSHVNALDRVWRTVAYGESPRTDDVCPHIDPVVEHSGPGRVVVTLWRAFRPRRLE
jgi:hypothetical protein